MDRFAQIRGRYQHRDCHAVGLQISLHTSQPGLLDLSRFVVHICLRSTYQADDLNLAGVPRHVCVTCS